MAGKLIAEEGLNKGLVLSFDEGEEWVVGRDPDVCQLIVEDPATSRRHLMCRKTPEGVLVENLSLTNPIQVNDIETEGPIVLKHGDKLKMGSGLFRFYIDTQARIVDESSFSDDESAIAKSSGSSSIEERHDTIFGDEEENGSPGFADLSFNLSAAGRWMLKVISGPNNGAEFSMEKGHSYLVGTDAATCDIVFHDLSVSRQHARLTIGDDETLTVEDLGSRNGTQVDSETIKGRKKLNSNALIALGTTAFVVIDRETERQTIVPPPLTTLGRIVQSPETIQAAQAAVQKVPQLESEKPRKEEPPKPVTEPARALNALILLAIVTGLFITIGLGTTFLFKTEDVVVEKVDVTTQLTQTFNDYPSLRYSFSKSTGRLLILGHLLAASDRNQLLYNIQGLPFVKKVEDSIIIDELVWQESNQVISKNPNWKSISISSPSPGKFVLTGSLKTRAEADTLSDYLSLNFPYPELLEKKLIVEEDVIGQISRKLQEKGLKDVTVEINNGEVLLSGNIPFGKKSDLNELVVGFKQIQGIRNVKVNALELEQEDLMVNLSSQYEVTGYSNVGGANVNVVINGKILTVGDSLDGMKIVSVRPGTILLEKDGFKYKIDYNK